MGLGLDFHWLAGVKSKPCGIILLYRKREPSSKVKRHRASSHKQMNVLLVPRQDAVYAKAQTLDHALLKGGVIEQQLHIGAAYEALEGYFNQRIPVELFEVYGDRSFIFRFDQAPAAQTFLNYFEANIVNVLFVGSGLKEMIGTFVVRVMHPGKDRYRSIPQKFSSWRDGDRNCLVGPICDRLDAKVDALRLRVETKDTKQARSALTKMERKAGIARRVLDAVKETGASTDWVEYLCEHIEICVEVRSMIAVYHKAKCQVCLSFIVDASDHVCGQDGSKKTVDSVTLYKCDKTRLCHDLSFVFVETRDAHVEYVGDARAKPTCFLSSHAEPVVCDDLRPQYNALIASDTIFMFDLDVSGRVRKIMQTDGVPMVTEPLPFWDIHRKFLKETGLDACFIDAVTEPELSSFVAASMGHNTTFDYPGFDHMSVSDCAVHDWIGSIDLKRAYANVGHCDFFSGYLGKIHEFRLMSGMLPERNGIYWVTDVVAPMALVAIPFLTAMFVEGCYPSPELRFWESLGVSFRVVAGCVGGDIDFNFNDFDEMMEKHPMCRGPDGDTVSIRGYCLSTGVMQLRSLVESHRLFIGSKCMETFQGIPSVFVNESERTAVVTFPKSSAKHLCHVVSFIFAYVRIAVIQQVMAMGAAVLRVCVDGIYYDSRLYTPPLSCPRFDMVWGVKATVGVSNIPSRAYVCKDLGFGVLNLATLSDRHSSYVAEQLIVGMGGNGKSHLVCTDVMVRGNPTTKARLSSDGLRNGGLVRALLFVPTLGQMREKLADYPGVRVWTHAKLFNFLSLDWHPNIEEVRRWASVLLFDECSMIPDSTRELVVSKFGTHKIVWLGDVGYQCEPFPIVDESGVKQHRPEFDASNVAYVTELVVNYRIKCPVLLQLAMDLRNAIDRGLSPAAGSILVRAAVSRITLRDLRSIYCKGDFVLCRTHQQIAGISNLLKTAFGQYKNAKNRLVDLDGRYARFDVVDYTDHAQLTGTRSLMHCHGFTVHAAQGATIKPPRRVMVCLERDMELRVLYTAITRCEFIHQLMYFDETVSFGEWGGGERGGDADGQEKEDEGDYEDAVWNVGVAIEAAVVASWRRSAANQVVPKRRAVASNVLPVPPKNRRITDFFQIN